MDPTRPLDALQVMRDKRVIVELKSGRQFDGVLKAFDIHINTVLFDARELGVEGASHERLFLRGDSILLVTPKQ